MTVVRHLDAKGVEYKYVDLTLPENADWLSEFKDRNLTQVPQTIRGSDPWIEGVDFDSINRLF